MKCICGRRGKANVQFQPIPNLGARRGGCLAIRSGRFLALKDLVYVWVNGNGKKSDPRWDSIPGLSSLYSATMYKISRRCSDDKQPNITAGWDKILDYTSRW